MTAAHSRTAAPAHSINLVYKDNARCVLFSLIKQISYAAGSHTHKHFDKFRAANAEKRCVSFTSNGSRQQRFTSTRRPDQKYALGNLGPNTLKLFRILQKLNNLLEVLL